LAVEWGVVFSKNYGIAPGIRSLAVVSVLIMTSYWCTDSVAQPEVVGSIAQESTEEILAQHELVLDDPEPVVRLHTLGESSVDFVVRPWVKTDDYWDVHWDVTRAVKMRFDEEGVSIPFPQRDVHIYEEKLARGGAGSDETSSSEGTPSPAPTGGEA
jgi:small-conductance mechanosensitive channel